MLQRAWLGNTTTVNLVPVVTHLPEAQIRADVYHWPLSSRSRDVGLVVQGAPDVQSMAVKYTVACHLCRLWKVHSRYNTYVQSKFEVHRKTPSTPTFRGAGSLPRHFILYFIIFTHRVTLRAVNARARIGDRATRRDIVQLHVHKVAERF